jgi:hypothetical protein
MFAAFVTAKEAWVKSRAVRSVSRMKNRFNAHALRIDPRTGLCDEGRLRNANLLVFLWHLPGEHQVVLKVEAGHKDWLDEQGEPFNPIPQVLPRH